MAKEILFPKRARHLFRLLALLLILFINFAAVSGTVRAGSTSDLTVDSIWLEEASQPGQSVSQISPGQSFLIVVTIKNIGQESAPGFYLDIYYDNDYGRGGPDDILAGEVQTWYVGPLTAQDGAHTVRWVADPDNVIAELDESNNQKEDTFTVGEQTPTLSLTPTSSSAGTLVTASGSNYQGTTCLLTVAPSSLFNSQACSIVAGALTGSFAVDSGASAGVYTVTVQTNIGEGDSATADFAVAPSYVVTFYTDPSSATVTVGVAAVTDGTTGMYLGDQRVHVVANPPSGYSFVSWEASGVSIDDAASPDTYMTVSDDGWLKVHFSSIPSETQVRSKTVFGDEFSGVRVKVGWRESGRTRTRTLATSFSLDPSAQGIYKFTAPTTVRVAGVQYGFAHWEDQTNTIISGSRTLSYEVQPGKTLYAVYGPRQYRLTVEVKLSGARVSGATVEVTQVGHTYTAVTNSRGKAVIGGIYGGQPFDLRITINGIVRYETTLTITRNTTHRAYIT